MTNFGSLPVGDVLGVLVESDGDVGVVKHAVKVSAGRIDLLWGSADFMQVGVSTLFESRAWTSFASVVEAIGW